MSLIDKARKIKARKSRQSKVFTQEDIDLALAWVREEVTLRQVAHVTDTYLKTNGAATTKTNIYLLKALKKYIQEQESDIL